MVTVSGIIKNKETGIGISDLLVVLFDVDGFKDPEHGETHSMEPVAKSFEIEPEALISKSHRIGSILTNDTGQFSIPIQKEDFITGKENEQKPDILLLVMAPEEPGLEFKERILFFSTDLRINAGSNEAYIIKLGSELLKKKGLLHESKELTAQEAIGKFRQDMRIETEYNAEVEQFRKEENAKKVAAINQIKERVKGIIIPKDTNLNLAKVVGEDEKVSDVLDNHFKGELNTVEANINEVIASGRKGIEIRLILNQYDRERLGIDPTIEGSLKLSGSNSTELLKMLNYDHEDSLILTSNNPILKACLTKNDTSECAKKQLDLYTNVSSPEVSEENDEATNSLALSKDEIDNYLRNALENSRIISNKSHINASKATLDKINDSIDGFSLKKGPAELPSLYDFNVLNIAFDHVWKQIVDQTPINNVAKLIFDAEKAGAEINIPDQTNPNTLVYVLYNEFYISLQQAPDTVKSNFDITEEEWNVLGNSSRRKLIELSEAMDKARLNMVHYDISVKMGVINILPKDRRIDPFTAEKYLIELKEKGELILDNARYKNVGSFHKILADLDFALKSPYCFNIYGADHTAKSVNFGLLNTYRQKWHPISYQVGDLVRSIPLAPKEERKYSIKTVFNRKRSEKEAQKNNHSLTQDSTSTIKAESEIVEKVNLKATNNSSGEVNYAAWKATASLGLEAVKDSAATKKDYREAVKKATEEYKQERSLEISSEESYSSEFNESGMITNPNDELSVTYLFYELQKRFRVSEQLYRVMPVVLVAQDVPNPAEISEAWVITNDWILNRTLLDDSFRPALHFLSQKNVGDDYAIRELRKNLRTQRKVVERLTAELTALKRETNSRYIALEEAIATRINVEGEERNDGFLADVQQFLLGSKDPAGVTGGINPDPEMAKALEQAARDAQAYAVEKAEKMAENLSREVYNLRAITEQYTEAMRDHLDKKTMVERFLVHLKSNIIYYMQAIWKMENPEQRFMRLLDVKVPQFKIESVEYEINNIPENDLFQQFRDQTIEELVHKAWFIPSVVEDGYKSLVEVADLDTLLGFEGNYMVFPMKHHNAITDIMAMPYIDASFGAMDPDQLSNISLDDYERYICCLREQMTEAEFDEMKPTLKNWLKLLMSDSLRNGDEIIVPTNSLYIEMLLSANTMLEDFKLKHREWDVYKVQAEVQMQTLENIRMSKRILVDELEDPKVDKKVIVKSNGNINIDS